MKLPEKLRVEVIIAVTGMPLVIAACVWRLDGTMQVLVPLGAALYWAVRIVMILLRDRRTMAKPRPPH
ncbi:hypothetical protein [Natronoglycomyces albus]|uniref:Uncharacterized protein n=1 Tax=Natronoglycomyces albus TaxID=2811108 RepID=A0A895XT94_9ACTN|nr:hypothetical protein [Natronoglycomyces albus]QSB06713.1 hypothetical protein JQS30_07415 [Natronoglycomyces albus]